MDNPHLALAAQLAAAQPHTFTIQYPPARRYFQERFTADVSGAWAGAEDALLYVHVPFCEAKCHYCNFAVDLRRAEALHARYVDALVDQLARLEGAWPARLRGIDIGGGTPTRLSAPLLARLMAALMPWRGRLGDVQRGMSIETTPRIAAMEAEKLDVLVAGGCARVSIGFQSTGEAVLAGINRRLHGEEVMGRAVENVRAAGFERLNIDLIFGLPEQSAAQWAEDVARVIALGPDSVTIYDCLYRGAGRALPRLARAAGPPAPATYGALYDLAYGMFSAAGYVGAYGSVNLSRRAEESGTSAYFEGRLWRGEPYVGVGNYASSAVGDAWWFAPYEVDDWLAAVEGGALLPSGAGYRLPWPERLAKAALAQLNYGRLDLALLARSVGAPPDEVRAAYSPALAAAHAQGQIAPVAADVWGLEPGRFWALYGLRASLYTPEALAWVAAGG
jgi:oxygen-independent coproporphyrinogen-3 oxidase